MSINCNCVSIDELVCADNLFLSLQQMACIYPQNYEDFNSRLNNNTLTFVLFSAQWCQYCTNVAPAFTDLPRQYPQFIFIIVDIDVNNETAASCGVTKIPTVLVFEKSKIINNVIPNDVQELVLLLRYHTEAATNTRSYQETRVHRGDPNHSVIEHRPHRGSRPPRDSHREVHREVYRDGHRDSHHREPHHRDTHHDDRGTTHRSANRRVDDVVRREEKEIVRRVEREPVHREHRAVIEQRPSTHHAHRSSHHKKVITVNDLINYNGKR